MTEPVRLAVVGAGLFAREAHLPAILELGDQLQVVCVCDRNLDAAAALADDFADNVRICDSIDSVVDDPSVEAVDLVLPPLVMPEIIIQALAAGKHVFSEKPIAPNLKTGRQLLHIYQKHLEQVWIVAENWRHEPAIRKAAEIVAADAIGKILVFHWMIHYPVHPGHKYYDTDWRRSSEFRGGLLLDGGVHHIAALRHILGPVQELSAMIAVMNPELPQGDTLSVSLRFDRGVIGNYQISYSTKTTAPASLLIAGEKGNVWVNRKLLCLEQDGKITQQTYPMSKTIRDELVEFVGAIRLKRDYINTPNEALQDLAIMEACFESAASGQVVKPIRI